MSVTVLTFPLRKEYSLQIDQRTTYISLKYLAWPSAQSFALILIQHRRTSPTEHSARMYSKHKISPNPTSEDVRKERIDCRYHLT